MIANTIGVKFMLQGSHYLSVKMLASNYQNWLDHFKKTNRFASLSGTCMATGINWAICGEDVVGAHSFDWEAAQAHAAAMMAQQQAPQGNMYRRLSGN